MFIIVTIDFFNRRFDGVCWTFNLDGEKSGCIALAGEREGVKSL